MLPHEVVSGVGVNSSGRSQPRPHSRQVEPSMSRANGRIGAALRQAAVTNNSGGAGGPPSHGGAPFISKYQILRDGGLLNLTHPVAGRSTLMGENGTTTTSPTRTRQPGRPESTASLIGSKVMPRRIGNAYVNPKTVTVGTSMLKSAMDGSPSTRALSPSAVAADIPSPNTANPSARSYSPKRMTTGAHAIGEQYRDQIVRPSSRYAASSSRGGAAPTLSSATLSPQRSPTAKSRSKTSVVSQRIGIVPPQLSPSSLRSAGALTTTSGQPSHHRRGLGDTKNNNNLTTDGRGAVEHFIETLLTANATDTLTKDAELDEQVLHPLRAVTGTTLADLMGPCGVNDADGENNDGLCLADLVSMDCLAADLKTLEMDITVPSNDILTLRPPQLTLLDEQFITRPLLAVKGGGATAGTSSSRKGVVDPYPSKTAVSSPIANSSISEPPALVHHIVVDLSHWGDASQAPVITIPSLFAQKGSIGEHLLDRSLEFVVKASNQSMFMFGTPSISCGTLGSESGTARWLEGAGLVMALNPNHSGSTRLSVSLVDNAAVDLETGQLLTSSEIFVILLHVTKNGVVQGASTANGGVQKSTTTSSPPSSPEKGLTHHNTSRGGESSNTVAIASLLPIPFLASIGITNPATVDISLPPLSSLSAADAAKVIRPTCPAPDRVEYELSHTISHPSVPTNLPPRSVSGFSGVADLRGAYEILDQCIPGWENTSLYSHFSATTTAAAAPILSECFLLDSARSTFGQLEEDDHSANETGGMIGERHQPHLANKLEIPAEGDIYAAFDFPKFDAYSLRKECMLHNQLECCERFFGKRSGATNASSSPGATDTSSYTSVPFAQASVPIAPTTAPPILSTLSPYEMFRYPYTREERKVLLSLNSPQPPPSSSTAAAAAPPPAGDQEATLRGLVDELYSTVGASALFDSDNTVATVDDGYDPVAADDLANAMLDLAGVHARLALLGTSSSRHSSTASVNVHTNEAIELFEQVARIQGFAIGINRVDMVGGVQLNLAQRIVSHKKMAMHDEVNECTTRCEEFVETLTTAATFLKHVGRFTESLQLLDAALRASDHYLGGENTSTLRVMTQVAECHYAQGNLLLSLDMLKKAIEVAGILVGSESTTATNLELQCVLVLGDLGDTDNALDLVKKVVQHREADVIVLSNAQLDTDPQLILANYLLAQSFAVLTYLEAQTMRTATIPPRGSSAANESRRQSTNSEFNNNSSGGGGPSSNLQETLELVRHVIRLSQQATNEGRSNKSDSNDDDISTSPSTTLIMDCYMLMQMMARASILMGKTTGIALAGEAAIGLSKLQNGSSTISSTSARLTTIRSGNREEEEVDEVNIQPATSDGEEDDQDRDDAVDPATALHRFIQRVASGARGVSSSPSSKSSVPTVDVAMAVVDVVLQKMWCNAASTYHETFQIVVENALDVLSSVLGPLSLATVRVKLVAAQQLRFKSWKQSLVICGEARSALLRMVASPPQDDQHHYAASSVPTSYAAHPDLVACESSLALSLLASLHSLCGNGRLFSSTLQHAVDAVERAQHSLEGIEEMGRLHHTHAVTVQLSLTSSPGHSSLNNKTNGFNYVGTNNKGRPYLIATDPLSEWLVEPTMLSVFSLAQQKVLPTSISSRLLTRVEFIHLHHGESSLLLVEPLYMLGIIHFIQDDYTGSHHYLSKALKCADTINFLFLLGHLFKPAAQLTTSDAGERNRVAKERLQPPQALQFASILFAIASTYSAQGNTEDAQTTFLQALAALELAQCGHSLATAHGLSSLAKLLYEEGHYGDALAHILKAIALVDEYHISIGEDAVNNNSCIREVGAMYSKAELDEVLRVINVRLSGKGYVLSRHYDSNHRFMVQM